LSFLQRIGGNRLVWALSLARMGDAIGNSVLFVVVPLYVSALPHPLVSLSEPLLVAVLIAVYGFLSSVFQPITGALSDWSRRPKLLIQLGLGISIAATIGFIWAGEYRDLLWLRIGQGVGFAFTVPASLALMTIVTRHETRGGSMGIFTTMRMVGFSIGPLLGGFLQVHFGFTAAFAAAAGFVAIGLLAVGIWVREQHSEGERRKFRIVEPGLFTQGILAVSTATFVMAAAFSEIVPLEKQINARTGETAVGFGLSFTALMISRLLLQIPLGHLSDRIGRKPLIIGGLLVLAPATALLATSHSVWALAGWRVMQGVAAAAIAAPAFAVTGDLARGGGEGRQMSAATIGFTLGLAVGPLLAGWLVRYFFELPFIVSAAMCIASAAIIYRFVPETVRRAYRR
jgi:MFS family permease